MRGAVHGRAAAVLAAMSLMTAGGLAAPAAAAVTCPTVSSTGVVSPAPSDGVDWAGCDLTGASLPDAPLRNADLDGANLTRANLTGADLYSATLKSATLTKASLTGANIGFTAMESADLASANLTSTTGIAIDMQSATLSGTNLKDADLEDSTVTDADINGTIFTGANVTQLSSGGVTGTPAAFPAGYFLHSGYLVGPAARLIGVDFAGLDLAGKDLAGVDFQDADLTGANLAGTDLHGSDDERTNFTGASLKSDNISGAALVSTVFSGADLSGANLSSPFSNLMSDVDFANANLTNANLAGTTFTGASLGGATLTGATLTDVVSGGITGTPAALPASWELITGYLIGPAASLADAYLPGLQLAGADLTKVDFSGANLTGGDFSGANLTGSYLATANMSKTNMTGADMAGSVLSFQEGGGYFPVNFSGADLAGADFAGSEMSGIDLSGVDAKKANFQGVDMWHANLQGTNLTDASMTSARLLFGTFDGSPDARLTGVNFTDANLRNSILDGTNPYLSGITWLDTVCPNGVNSRHYVDGCFSKLDTTPPAVTVTGVGAGARYVLGAVPRAGCQTTDKFSPVKTPATVKVTTTGKNGTGKFTATCSGAVDQAGNKAKPVHVDYMVVYGFGGFSAPRPGATVRRSAGRFTARFRLVSASGSAISASVAAGLATAGEVRVTLTGPGISQVKAACGWARAARQFQCTVTIPRGVRTGSARYRLAAEENPVLGEFVTVPVVKKAVNPEKIGFR